MSNEEVKRCPLCAEEMDWTDQQFKPCKCGYQVCVWCWHHIMDLAEKEETEGRCPGCQTVYEKDKIVAMQAKCEMDVTKNCKKSKPPKAKPKTTEVKKDLTSVRVIRRKMAYIIGLPLSLADENLLQRKEYFGQYGKISKISLSRGAGGTIQQFVHETCSVYVTYSKEEEAIRCIQSVHGFVLEGRILRASFGTAKYCHAWLKNIPCNNHACLYLHSIAPEEDTFGKDEVAAVHTRNRVQQIVGATDNVSRRCGSILPSPLEELSNGSSLFIEKITSTRSLSDTSHNGYLSGNLRSPSTSTSFVDIVQRPSSSCTDEDIVGSEDKISLDLGADISRIKPQEDNHVGDVNSNSDSVQYTLPASSHIVSRPPEDSDSKEFSVDVLRDDMLQYKDPLPKDIGNLSGGGYFHQSSYPAEFLEDPNGPSVLHERNHSSSNIRTDQNSVHSFEAETSLPFKCVNSLLNESNELDFQSTVKSNRIRRNSNLFSTEEIVEHLRRMGDNSLSNDEEMSSFDAVESNIISNILSMGLDSSDDSMTLPHGLNDLLDERDDRHGSSWNSYTSAKSGVSFAKEDGFAGQLSTHQCSLNNPAKVSSTCSIGKDYPGSLDHYVFNPQYQAPRSPSLAPPGFSLPCREAPPGFSSFEKTGRVQHSPSGGLVKNSSLPNGFFQTPLIAGSNGISGEVDFYDPAILRYGKGKPTNGLENVVFGTRPIFNNHLSSFEDESKLLLLMQQQQQPPLSHHNRDSIYSGNFLQQTPHMFKQPQVPLAHAGNQRLSGLDDVYGYPPRLISQPQTYSPSTLMQMSQQKLVNRQVSNGRQNSMDVIWKNDACVADIQRNERQGLDKYFSGYGDLVYQMAGGDLYRGGFNMM